MNILVINTGSSSIKYQLFDMNRQSALVMGVVEKIGEASSLITHTLFRENGEVNKKSQQEQIVDHSQGLSRIVDLLVDPEHGAIRDKSEIAAVGHRVVHGGEACQTSTIIDDHVIAALKENSPLAPLHNPPNLIGIEVARSIFPNAPQVAVFDTSFHHTIPKYAFLYALPYHLYTRNRIRRYGFHGTSHSYVAERAAEYLNYPLQELNLITLHLGNGASMAAVKQGVCVDTTMGMTPLEGLVMGTRSGDIDPALPFFLAENLHMTLPEIDALLNKKSGLKGLCGTNDMREVEDMAAAGNERAQVALQIYCYRIKKYLGAFAAVLGKLDAVVFTAGIGENSPAVRKLCCQGLELLDISIDETLNAKSGKPIREINEKKSRIKVLVIPTNEEKKIALETKRIIDLK